MGHERSPSQNARRYQFDYVFRFRKLRSVDFTAVANADFFQQAVDATAGNWKIVELASVVNTAAGRDWRKTVEPMIELENGRADAAI